MPSVRRARPADLGGALDVWVAANRARGRAPSPERVERVREKLADPAALTVVALDDKPIIGMALGEPGREDDGAGALVPSLLHVSMVFVEPTRQGAGIGRALLDELFALARGVGYARATLWTAQDNERARRLYVGSGMRPTGRTHQLGSYGLTVQLGIELGQ